MAIDSLDTPLRVTWDLCSPDLSASTADALKVAERLAEAQLFYVTLEQTPLLHPVFREVVGKLSAVGCQLLVVCRGRDDELIALSELPAGATILLEVDDFISPDGLDINGLEKVCNTLDRAGCTFGLSLTPTRNRLDLIGALIQFCLERNIPRFKLPNMRINANFSAANRGELVRPEDVERFRKLAAAFPDFQGKLQLDVHDLFLWEILFPEGGVARSEYGGCQAANSLAHIDFAGAVHPCVSWPQPLGSLLDNSFYDIWQAAPRQAVRSEIASVPAGCKGCRDYAICFGGCRGLTRLDESLNGRDPMCEGVRS
jgi:GeoRSP system SPASM domain protein